MHKEITTMIAALAQLEKDVPGYDRGRKKILERLREDPSEVYELENLIEWRIDQRNLLERLDLALKNSIATFLRFDQKAAKDAQLLAEFKKAGKGGRGFNDKDPILLAQRQAIAKVRQKLGFFASELDKLRASISYKYGKFPELDALRKALERDRDFLTNHRETDNMDRLLDSMEKMHQLS